MKQSSLDLAVDIINKKMLNIKETLRLQMKGVRPYRSVPMKDEEIIAKYMEVSQYPEVKQQLMQSDPDAWQGIEDKVSKIMSKVKGV